MAKIVGSTTGKVLIYVTVKLTCMLHCYVNGISCPYSFPEGSGEPKNQTFLTQSKMSLLCITHMTIKKKTVLEYWGTFPWV